MPIRAFLLTWTVFWVLLTTLDVQEHLRRHTGELWKPLFCAATSCLMSSLIVWALWRHVARRDTLLTKPLLWLRWPLILMVPLSLAYVASNYGLRHGVLAALGIEYRHDPWAVIFRFETIKFAVFYLLFVALFYAIRLHAALNVERLRAERARVLAEQSRLLQLTQAIEPHFLFNALNTIAATVHERPTLADELITSLSALLRASTELEHQPMVTLADEVRLLEHYAAIMTRRFGDRVVLDWLIDERAHLCRVPTLCLQSLLENAYRHGAEATPGPVHLQVVAKVDSKYGKLTLSVCQDVGSLPEPVQMGVGLTNLRNRLRLAFGDQAALMLHRVEPRGVMARVELPCDC